jgi:hypothetical protein
MLAFAAVARETVVIVKLAVVAPAATVTLTGTAAAALSLERLTTAPSLGARLPSVTVPVEDTPPTTLFGVSATDESVAGLSVKAALFVPLYVAEIFAVAAEPTGLVVTANVAVVSPAATVTLAGTAAAALSLESVTIAPPAGAALLSVTVAVEEEPPLTVLGLRPSDDNSGGLIVRLALALPL